MELLNTLLNECIIDCMLHHNPLTHIVALRVAYVLSIKNLIIGLNIFQQPIPFPRMHSKIR